MSLTVVDPSRATASRLWNAIRKMIAQQPTFMKQPTERLYISCNQSLKVISEP